MKLYLLTIKINKNMKIVNIMVLLFLASISFAKAQTFPLDFETGKLIDTLFSNQLKQAGDSLPTTFTFFEDYKFSPDDSKILIQTQIEPLFSKSTKEFNYVWDVSKKVLKTVCADGKQSYVSFSPDSKKIAYIREGKLYKKDLETDAVQAVSYDGATGSIL